MPPIRFLAWSFAHSVLQKEALILLLMVFFFWYPSPSIPTGIDRAAWFWLFGLLPPVLLARLALHGRLWTPTPLDAWLLLFVGLCVLNIHNAPYPSRGWMMLARPMMGMALLIYLVELTRRHQSLKPAAWVLVSLALWVGLLALTTTQWTEKSADLWFILEALPSLDPPREALMAALPFLKPYLGGLSFLQGGFNPNEIGGGLAWLIPLCFGLMSYPRTAGQVPALQICAGGAFFLLLLALMLGQSRAAIIGVIFALTVLSLTLVPAGGWRRLALMGVICLTVLQSALFLNLFPKIGTGDEQMRVAAGLSMRDERTTSQRFDIWNSAFTMLQDHPLTGVGMARFRYRPVRDAYPVPDFDYPANLNQTNFNRRLIPHAHNEFIQIATDLGLPGLLVFIAWNLSAGYMVLACWRRGDAGLRVVALAAGLGLWAHFIYGLGDAIPLWDRLSFIYWLLLGLVASAYVQVKR